MRRVAFIWIFLFYLRAAVADGDTLSKTTEEPVTTEVYKPIDKNKSIEINSTSPLDTPTTVSVPLELSTTESVKTDAFATTEQPIVKQTKTETTTEKLEATTSSTESTSSQVETTTEGMAFINIDFDKEDDETAATTTLPPDVTSSTVESTTMDIKTRRERLSDQIRAVIKHYKEYGTVTVPDASVPDPMTIPNIKKTFSGNDMTFTNTKVYGLSNFTIEHINTDLDKMQVYVAIYMKKLIILGNYTAKFFFKKVSGPFNVTLLYVEASGAAALVRDKDGNLLAQDSQMDMTFMDSKVRFGNMGLMGSLLQGMAASAGPVLFEAIKPIVLMEINNKVRDDVNKKIKMIGTKFAESGSEPPLDVAVKEAQNYVRENGYDPYHIDNYVLKYMPTNQSLFKVNISRLILTGLSNFRRVGDVSLSMDDGTVQMGIHLATSKLRGKCEWSFNLGRFERKGHTNFTIDYVQGRGFVNQSLDVSKHPVLEDLDVNVGKVRIQMKGTGPFDIVLEAVINSLPDLIRHIVVDAIEVPLKYALQHILSEINVEEVLDQKLPELDKMGL